MGDISKILESQPKESLKHKRCKVLVIKNDANI